MKRKEGVMTKRGKAYDALLEGKVRDGLKHVRASLSDLKDLLRQHRLVL